MKSLLKAFGYLIRGFWQGLSVCRVIIGNLVFLALIILFLSFFFYGDKQDIPDQAALILSPQGDIVIQKTETILSSRLMGEASREETLLKDIIDVIDHAKDDQRVKALVLDLQDMGSAASSKLADIGQALLRFKTGGKPIYASADYYGQQQYYLAAHADHLYLHPMGGVALTGFGIYRNYFKSALEKLMIQFHVFRVGTYKSALEPFLRDNMSEYAKEANLSWLSVLWDTYAGTIAELRGLPPEAVDNYINNVSENLSLVKGDTAQLALDHGLVDALKTRDEVREELIALVGEDEDEMTINKIQFDDYLAAIKPQQKQTRDDTSKVGVIVAKGIILDGVQPAGKIGGDTLTDLIRQARLDDEVKALVLQIDSPGGSALASELIRRELELTRQSGKPVIASMSSIAASGGYWIASPADEIWAAPTTITGSIGIYSAFATLEKSLDYLGIHNDGVGTTRVADAFDTARPLNPIIADSMEQVIQHNYRRFIKTVSEGRNLTLQDVEKIAQGRVWSGKTAKELGLVDQFGNLQDAVQSAANMVNLKDYDVIYIEQPQTAREKLIKQLNHFLAGIANNTLGSVAHPAVRFFKKLGPELEAIIELNDPQGVYAYCLVCDVH
ncbi:MAG: signal peptide peptidase SppA [Desulfobacterales bacterium]|jgi:protease-4